MEKSRKRMVWLISLLLLILVMGCSLKIDIDPSKLGKSKSGQSEGTR